MEQEEHVMEFPWQLLSRFSCSHRSCEECAVDTLCAWVDEAVCHETHLTLGTIETQQGCSNVLYVGYTIAVGDTLVYQVLGAPVTRGSRTHPSHSLRLRHGILKMRWLVWGIYCGTLRGP